MTKSLRPPVRLVNQEFELSSSKTISQNPSRQSKIIYQDHINNIPSVSAGEKSKCTLSRMICIQLLIVLLLLVLAAVIIPIVVIVLDSRASSPCAITYSQYFTTAMTPSTQCTAWLAFTTSLTCSSYSMMRIYGSLDPTGLTISDASVATALPVALRYNTSITVVSNGLTWRVGVCSNGFEITSTGTMCACPTTASYTIRPCLGNPSWGGIAGTTCNSVSQTMSLHFEQNENEQWVVNSSISVQFLEERSTPIPDTEYEQVIAERYLFASFANESTAWPVLSNIDHVWQVVALPQYHSQASQGVWLLSQTIGGRQSRSSLAGKFQMSWMSLLANDTLVVLPEIEVKTNNSFLVSSHNDITASVYSAALISLDNVQLILCNQSDAASCRIRQTISFPLALLNTTKIHDGVFVTDLGHAGWLYIGADSGLHGLDLSTMTIYPYLNGINVSVSSLAWSSKQQTIFAGTERKLWIQQYGIENEGWRFEHVNAFIDAPIVSLVYNDVQDKLWIGHDTGITLLSPIVTAMGELHWYFSRLAGHVSNPGSDIGHLPFANITKLSASHSRFSDARVWLGSVRGVMRFDSNASDLDAWRVFDSARYIPNREAQVNVTSLAALSNAAVAVTTKGLAVLRFEMWTLARKAEHFQAFLDQPGRHEKYGLVAGCSMSSWGDTRTCVKEPDDNDGLWTSMYLASQVFRYAVTRDSAIKIQAWKHFEALELLNQVSGIAGYPGRSFAKRTDFSPDPHWHPSPINSTLQFKGDTSSDEIVGHEFVYPLVHDLLAENDNERQRAYILSFNITDHILTHDWYLTGENHTHTTWGIWNPSQINDDPFYQETRGLNSLQILAFLLQTYGYSGDQRFLNSADLLVSSHQYNVNLINQKTIAVCDNSFSDDELAYLSYFTLVHAFQTIVSSTSLSPEQKERAQILIDRLLDKMKIGLNLSHKYKKMEKSPFYNFIYCYVSGQVNQSRRKLNLSSTDSSDFDCHSLSLDGIWYMQRWPLEHINWQQFNSDRLDIQLNVEASCNSGKFSLKLLPPDERSSQLWNGNVYDLDDGNGFYEESPVSFLLGYWGMRYFNLLG